MKHQDVPTKEIGLCQRGPWSGKLVMRVLDASTKSEYQSLKPACYFDAGKLLSGSGPLHCLPWSSTSTDRKGSDNSVREDISGVGNTVVSDCSEETNYDLYLFNTNNDGEVLEVHQVHMNRKSNEEFRRVLKRLEISISKKLGRGTAKQNKKQKRNKQTNTMLGTSSVLWRRRRPHRTNTDNDSPLDGLKPWDTAGLTHLELRKKALQESVDLAVSVSIASENVTIPIEIDVCPPTVLCVQTFETFEASILVGVPLVVETQVMYGSRAIVDWYVGGSKVQSDSPCYTPVQEDVGKEVAVVITPVRKNHSGRGCEEAYRFKNSVEPLPRMPILNPLREEWINGQSPTTNKSLRIVTYNILADQNAYPRDSSVENIYPYCDLKFLARSRRMPMIVYEILAYQADIICLQEVDEGMYESLFGPVLSAKGYQGFYSVKKTGSTREGCAMFWSLRSFERVLEEEMTTHVIRDLFPEPVDACIPDNDSSSSIDSWESIRAIGELLHKYDNLKDVIQNKLGHVLQVTKLTPKQGRFGDNVAEKVVVANTHLFFHPNAGHIRMMQLLVSCNLLDSVRKQDREKWPLVFCGDFNSLAHSGSCKLMYERTVPPNHNNGHTWEHLQSFVWERDLRMANSNTEKDADTQLPTLSLPPEFPRLCSGWGGVLPEFTHYIVGFQGVLDHILVSETSNQEPYGFRPKKWAAMPTEKDITQYVAMPNEFMPSDHIALVCDIELVSYNK